jgi:ribosomal protein L11 methylase PrmA
MKSSQRLAASFRDPSGFLFTRDDTLYRQVNRDYQENYEHLMDSGLYTELIDAGLLIHHAETSIAPEEVSSAFKVIQPEPVHFISYPYEWCFSQLKDAALATLAVQKIALKHDMSLKDCSAYNIQFHHGAPVLIDSLSFEVYREGEPWVAYRQFCQHFLAPLALMAHRDIRLNQLLRVYIDGIPLDLASRLLPRRTMMKLGLLSHIHLHAASQRRYADKAIEKESISRRMSRTAFYGLIDSLETSVRGLKWEITETEWGDYYEVTHNYTADALEHKQQLVDGFLTRVKPQIVWDLGANVGLFSRLASKRGIRTLAFDIDPTAVELNYRTCKSEGNETLLPLLLDLTNPSPALGWHNRERLALHERGPADVVLALALIHHLTISNNVPLDMLAQYFRPLSPWLIIEFVPKSDPQVQRLLSTREDIFPNYTQAGFEQAFESSYSIRESTPVEGMERVLYLMEGRPTE